ncbi:hypothetical protein L1987_73045 [Smallanthus sonchifolius]|uniref:Uncharacterized protein n=1 Tax=Smallanthus sonchifolius TaxID=185202 RepID=A0ACB9AXL0_9ASTR|nr:hypothetical protein L1987_73045 [Smallanthus sonchifolius]
MAPFRTQCIEGQMPRKVLGSRIDKMRDGPTPKVIHKPFLNLYGFDDGYLAAVRFRTYGNETEDDDDDVRPNDIAIEEVDSETGGNAGFMKSDGQGTMLHEGTRNKVTSPHVNVQSSNASGRDGDLSKPF